MSEIWSFRDDREYLGSPKHHRLFDMCISQREIKTRSDSSGVGCLLHEAALSFKVGDCSLLLLHHDLCISPLSRGSPDCTSVVRVSAAAPSKKPGHQQYRNLITTWAAGQMYLDTHARYILQPSPSTYATRIAYRWK